jgi:hypothetical protein
MARSRSSVASQSASPDIADSHDRNQGGEFIQLFSVNYSCSCWNTNLATSTETKELDAKATKSSGIFSAIKRRFSSASKNSIPTQASKTPSNQTKRLSFFGRTKTQADTPSPIPQQPIVIIPPSFQVIRKNSGDDDPRRESISSQEPLDDDPVTAAARLQAFDGSFDLSVSLLSIFPSSPSIQKWQDAAPESIKSKTNAEKIWATVVVAALLSVKLAGEKEVWEWIYEKAQDYVNGELEGQQITFELLLQEAAGLL